MGGTHRLPAATMIDNESLTEGLLARLRRWAERRASILQSAGIEPEDLLQQALLRAVERGILERGLSPAACYSWLVRTMQFELSYQQRRRQPSSRPCRGTPLPWGADELDGEHLFLRLADDGLGERPALDDPDGLRRLDSNLWGERMALLLEDCFSTSHEVTAFLTDRRSRDAVRRLLSRARGRLRSGGS